MKIEYDKPIEVGERQYHIAMHKFCGIIAGRRSDEGKYFIKVWLMKYARLIESFLTTDTNN